MITHLQIEYFLVINEMRNISQAAQKLLVAQQTLSRSLDSIEKELGTRLFERGTPLTLTDSGRIFLDYAQEMVEKRHAMINAINDITGNVCGTIRLGIAYNRSPVLLPGTISAFQTRYPKIDFFIFEGNQEEIKQALLNRKIDLAIEHIPFRDKNILEEKLLEDQLYLLIPDELLVQRYGDGAQAVLEELRYGNNLRSLSEFPFLLNKSGNSIRAAMEAIFRREQIQPPIITETENMETLFNMCMIGRGVTVYPGSFLYREKLAPYEGRFHIANVPHAEGRYTLGAAYRQGHYLTQASKYFIELLRDHAQKIADRWAQEGI